MAKTTKKKSKKGSQGAKPVPGSPEIDTGTFEVLNVANVPVAWIHSDKDEFQNGKEYWFYTAGLVTPAVVGGSERWTLKRVALAQNLPDFHIWKGQGPQSGAAFKKRHRVDGDIT